MKKWIIIIITIAIIAGGIYAFSRYTQFQETTAQFERVQMIMLETGSLIATVSATGNVRSQQDAILTWSTSGTVERVFVELLDAVEEGDVLAVLEQTSLPQNVIQAQADLYNARVALDELNEGYSQFEVAQAAQAVAYAEEDLAEAETAYYNLSHPAHQTYIDQAFADLVLAEDRLESAQESYEQFANRPEDNLQRASALSRLADAEQAYYAALRNYNSVSNAANDISLTVGAAELEVARQSLAEAQAEYERVLAGPEEGEIAAAEARVTALEATLQQAWIEAPFDGTITQVDPQPGDQVSNNNQAFRLDDLSTMYIDVEISEIDIASIEVGQEAIITFDALPSVEYRGRVAYVALIGVESGGLVNFNVTVEMLKVDENIRPGMTAAVDIIISASEETLLIPNQAIRVEDGAQVVYVMNPESGLQPVAVTLGMSSETHSQVLAGDLAEGSRIVLNPEAVEENTEMPAGFLGIFRAMRDGEGGQRPAGFDGPPGEGGPGFPGGGQP